MQEECHLREILDKLPSEFHLSVPRSLHLQLLIEYAAISFRLIFFAGKLATEKLHIVCEAIEKATRADKMW